MLSWYHWIIVVVPIAFVLYMAVHSRRYARSVADYLVAGRVAGRYVLSTAGMMDGLAVLYLVSGAEANYQTGWAMGFWGNVLMPLGLFLGLFVRQRLNEFHGLDVVETETFALCAGGGQLYQLGAGEHFRGVFRVGLLRVVHHLDLW